MAVNNPRTRLVNFRVNEEEYATLRTVCAQNGARSISDFARLAVLSQTGEGEQEAASIQQRLSVLGHKMSELEHRVLQLLKLLDMTKVAGGENSPERRQQ